MNSSKRVDGDRTMRQTSRTGRARKTATDSSRKRGKRCVSRERRVEDKG